MKKSLCSFVGTIIILGALSTSAQVAISPLSTFGTGGWLAPGDNAYLGTGNTERGLAFADGEVFLVSRSSGNNIVAIDGTTGGVIGTLNTTGMSGGTFVIDSAAAGADGALYVANLTTSASSPFTVYAYANPLNLSAAPTVVYSGNPIIGTRFGDDLAATGSGASTLLVAGSGSGSSGYEVINPTTGTATAVSFSGTPPNSGDFRLGISFTDSSHVIGSQGNSLYRYSGFSGTTGTLLGSPNFPDPAGATADRLLAYTVLGGEALLAVQSTGDSHVSLYDVTDPNSPVYLTSLNNTTGALTSNANATGNLAWGDTTINGDGSVSQTLYAMSSNQGIQAFIVTVPEPASLSLLALGLAALAFRRNSAGK